MNVNRAEITLEKVKVDLPDARVVWGRLLLKLKQAGNVLLHSVCIELGKVKIEDNTLKVFVPNSINYETLKKPQNYANLVDSLAKLGYNLNIEFILDENVVNTEQDKVAKLEKILGISIQTI